MSTPHMSAPYTTPCLPLQAPMRGVDRLRSRALLALLTTACLFAGLAESTTSLAQEEVSGEADSAQVAEGADPLPAIQARWAAIRYALPESERAKAFAALVDAISRAQSGAPDDPRLRVWKGIVLASEAGAKGGLGALGLVKQAKAEFEAVIKQDGSVLDGSAYTSLGSLYYQVPGWPVGFGDAEKARALLQQGLSIAPDGIDANFFWGDFLLEQEDHAGAIGAFERALAAPPRQGRESADIGRRAEIEAALARARAELGG